MIIIMMIIAVDLSISPYFTVKDDNNDDDNSGRSFYIAVFHCQG